MHKQAQTLQAPEGASQAPAEYFTGVAWVKILVPAGDPTDCSVADVTFEAGARNNWHSHQNGQILLVTAGTGYYQEKGQPTRLLHPGDAVSIAPHVVHWHGATPNGRFTHVAINPSASQDASTVWLDRVTDADYQGAQA